MAKIKNKDISYRSQWTSKELRKLKINIHNRLESFSMQAKADELNKSHPLFQKSKEDCNLLLDQVNKAMRIIKKGE